MDAPGHEWTVFFLCRRCGLSLYDAETLNLMHCFPAEEVDAEDTPIIVEASQ